MSREACEFVAVRRRPAVSSAGLHAWRELHQRKLAELDERIAAAAWSVANCSTVRAGRPRSEGASSVIQSESPGGEQAERQGVHRGDGFGAACHGMSGQTWAQVRKHYQGLATLRHRLRSPSSLQG